MDVDDVERGVRVRAPPRQDGNSEKEKEGEESKKDREKRGWTPRCQVAR